MPDLALLAIVLLLGMLAGFSPTKAATTIMLLGRGTLRWPRVAAFAAGSTTVIVLIGFVASLSGITLEAIGGSRRVTGLIDLVLGLVLVTVAGIALVRARRPRPDGGTPAAGAGEPPPAERTSKVLAAAFGLGAGETIQAVGKLVLFAAAVNRIVATPLPVVLALVYFFVLVWLTQLPVWGPAVLFVRAPDRFARVSVEVDRRLSGPGSSLIVVATGAVGIGLVVLGLLLLGGTVPA